VRRGTHPPTEQERAWLEGVGRALRESRQRAGLSIRAAAEAADVSVGVLQAIEAGRTASLLAVQRLARVVDGRVSLGARASARRKA
jgi:transcriptional regulator with XRE-family HTH domain